MRTLRRHKGIVILFMLVLVALSLCAYFYVQYQTTQYLLNNPTAKNQFEIQQIVANVSKLVVIPNEIPTIATVSDVNKLQGQPFFKHAKNGDKVLLFQQAKEAILYDPNINKLINVGPINIIQITPTPSPTTTPKISPFQKKAK